VGHYSQLLVDGPCHVLLPGELQQFGLGRYFFGLCWTGGFCACYYGPPHVCSHLLRALSVAVSCSVVYRPKCQGFNKVAEFSLPSLLRHHPLSSSNPLRLLYIGFWTAVSPVRLECVLAKVTVRNIENFAVLHICRFYSLFDAFCCENEMI